MERLNRLLIMIAGLALLGFTLINATTFVEALARNFDPLMMLVETGFTVMFGIIAGTAIWIGME